MYRLYRPETQYHNGKHVRDLSKINRDLSQVLYTCVQQMGNVARRVCRYE